MTPTQTSGFPTLSSALDRRRLALGLSVTEVARRAGLPFATTQRRFHNATNATYGELECIAEVLDVRLSKMISEVEEQQAAILAAAGVSQVGSAA